MVPIYLLIMIVFNGAGLMGTVGLAAIMLAQVIIPLVNREHKGLHDLLAGTVTVDFASQKIFRTSQDLIDYKTKLHAENVARKDY